jgi:hypothetical protein
MSGARFAYADPPYPGQAARWYANHPDYGGEVDHRELVGRLCAEYAGWALSTSAAALPEVLAICPADIRIGVWYRSNSEPPGNRGRWWWSWEPVIFYGWRKEGETVRDFLSCPSPSSFPGQKPPAFTRWVINLLGLTTADVLVDLFPGSGAVTTEANQLTLSLAAGAVDE